MSSLAQQSPSSGSFAALGSKRTFIEEDDYRAPLSEISKRARQQPAAACSPGGFRCAPETQAYAVGHSTVVALRALFPDMNDKVQCDGAGC